MLHLVAAVVVLFHARLFHSSVSSVSLPRFSTLGLNFSSASVSATFATFMLSPAPLLMLLRRVNDAECICINLRAAITGLSCE